MSEYKIFDIDGSYWVLAKSEKEAIQICIDEDLLDENAFDEVFVKECNYKDSTWQPIWVLKNIFSEGELKAIEEILKYERDKWTAKKDGIRYYFEDRNDFDYIGVRLTFEQIMNTPEILKEFDFDTVISTTEW